MTEQAADTTKTSENKTISYHSKQQHSHIAAIVLVCLPVFGVVIGILTCHLLKRKKARNEILVDNGSENALALVSKSVN